MNSLFHYVMLGIYIRSKKFPPFSNKDAICHGIENTLNAENFYKLLLIKIQQCFL